MGTRSTGEIHKGLAALSGLPGVRVLGQPQWEPKLGRWVISLSVTADVRPDGPISETTRWFLLVDRAYPFGRMSMLPAKEGGVIQTFPHQRYNGAGSEAWPWRTGNICTETSAASLRRSGYDDEPADVESNLAWHVLRTQRWLELASRGEFDRPGDPYELPDIPIEEKYSIAFCEGYDSHREWLDTSTNLGTAQAALLPTTPAIVVVNSFSPKNGSKDIAQEWHKPITDGDQKRVAWIRLDAPPTLEPHQIPVTWGELRVACRMIGRDLDSDLKTIVGGPKLDWDILLVGFSIQERIEGPTVRTHWLALTLPPAYRFPQKGFRPNSIGKWLAYRSLTIHDDCPLAWISTENWDSSEMNSRGQLVEKAINQRVLIVGAGAVGSVLSEMLARAGSRQITLMDHDDLEGGNLVRHTLLLDDLGKSKAGAVTQRLDRATIHGIVTPIEGRFPPENPEVVEEVRNHDVVIDCTGDDSTAFELGCFQWEGTKLFVSISLGLYARRIFCFIASGLTFPTSDFLRGIGSWLQRETQEFEIENLPRDGPGCWSFRHPARIDDVWMMTAAALKVVERSMIQFPEVPKLVVIEQQLDDDGNFVGIKVVS